MTIRTATQLRPEDVIEANPTPHPHPVPHELVGSTPTPFPHPVPVDDRFDFAASTRDGVADDMIVNPDSMRGGAEGGDNGILLWQTGPETDHQVQADAALDTGDSVDIILFF